MKRKEPPTDSRTADRRLEIRRQALDSPRLAGGRFLLLLPVPDQFGKTATRASRRWRDRKNPGRSAASPAAHRRFVRTAARTASDPASAAAPAARRHCLRRPARRDSDVRFPRASFSLLPCHGTRPQPRQHYVNGEVGHALFAEQRLWLFQPGRAKRPVPRPIIVVLNLRRSSSANRAAPGPGTFRHTSVPSLRPDVARCNQCAASASRRCG